MAIKHRSTVLETNLRSNFQIFGTEDRGAELLLQIYERNSIEEVDNLLKYALHLIRNSSRLPGPLIVMQVARNKALKSGYQVEWIFENPDNCRVHTFAGWT